MDCCVGEGGFLGFDDIDVESMSTLVEAVFQLAKLRRMQFRSSLAILPRQANY